MTMIGTSGEPVSSHREAALGSAKQPADPR
jgi:hypothetical protein